MYLQPDSCTEPCRRTHEAGARKLGKKRVYQGALSFPASLQLLFHPRQVRKSRGMRHQCQCPLSSGKLLQRGLRTAARCRANGEQRWTEERKDHARPTLPHQQRTPADVHQPEESGTCQRATEPTGGNRQGFTQRFPEQRPALYAGQLLLYLRHECARRRRHQPVDRTIQGTEKLWQSERVLQDAHRHSPKG